mmetsp:Transcript_143796/g.460316  ORF Transcript_143796/g.460316 Transcript_143796/m.460316 type:complete len:263 (-) Transcript_143796:825-1613(-)
MLARYYALCPCLPRLSRRWPQLDEQSPSGAEVERSPQRWRTRCHTGPPLAGPLQQRNAPALLHLPSRRPASKWHPRHPAAPSWPAPGRRLDAPACPRLEGRVRPRRSPGRRPGLPCPPRCRQRHIFPKGPASAGARTAPPPPGPRATAAFSRPPTPWRGRPRRGAPGSHTGPESRDVGLSSPAAELRWPRPQLAAPRDPRHRETEAPQSKRMQAKLPWSCTQSARPRTGPRPRGRRAARSRVRHAAPHPDRGSWRALPRPRS